MGKYQHAKIYFISNNVDKLIYVGSTIKPLNIRFSEHKSRSKRCLNIKLYKHFAKLGIHHFKIILIKNYPCAGRTALDIEEERYKLLLNAQLNTYRAHQTAKQLKEQKNETNKKYRENNRDKIKLKQNERIFCKICGKTYTRQNKAWHNRSNHHQKCVQLNQSKQITDAKFEKCVQFNLNI